MKNLYFLTLFPNNFNNFINNSIIKRAIDKEKVKINLIDIRNYSSNKFEVDDYPYGGGPGQIIKLEPIVNTIRENNLEDSYKILLSPSGRKYNQKLAKSIVKYDKITFIIGYYEGIDYRINNYVDESISIGDYILTNGEIPSMVIADSLIRLIPGVLNDESLNEESFENDLLEYPQYTRPANFEDHKVPSVLLSGNHQEIEKWRLEQRKILTKKHRLDLLKEK